MLSYLRGIMQRQNIPVSFRVNEAVVAAAIAKAGKNGTSVSELIRQALRNELKEAA